jgi:hypothetical protein
VPLRAVAQKADSLASFQFHPDRRAAACTVFPAPRAASGALADQDAGLRQNAARFQESFQEPARDFLLASVETVLQDAIQPRQVPQPPAAQ